VTETLRFEEVSLAYRMSDDEEQVVAADRVSMSVCAGELVMIYGPSGAGKSTLLNLAAKLLVPDQRRELFEGRVLFEGHDLTHLKTGAAAEYRKYDIGYVTQKFTMIDAPAVENAALKLMGTGLSWREAEEKVAPILAEFDLNERKQRQKAPDLSMGEQQRVIWARALSNNPRLLLADEPTSHLDSRTGAATMDVLLDRCHNRGLAALMVTHNQSLARLGDHCWVLRDGQLRPYDSDALSVDALASE
jgi:putative ABC transport system ATP-binding protein